MIRHISLSSFSDNFHLREERLSTLIDCPVFRGKYSVTLEQINDELIIKGLELGFLHLLKEKYSDLTSLLRDNFDYNEETEQFTLREQTKFKTHLDVRLRIRYYILSYLRRAEREKRNPSFDEIVLYILPLLKNGITPENQTILQVLEDIAEQVDKDSWRLKVKGQGRIFGLEI